MPIVVGCQKEQLRTCFELSYFGPHAVVSVCAVRPVSSATSWITSKARKRSPLQLFA